MGERHDAAASLLATGSGKSADAQPLIELHPLVILTISDYVTRHALRGQQGPVVGAILGAQNGRKVTMEHAFECKLARESTERAVMIDQPWFAARLQQLKDVHKLPSPALDLVGWFTMGSTDGPQYEHLAIHRYLSTAYNDALLMLVFQPSTVLNDTSKGGKLPISIYESEPALINGQSSDAERFREVLYTIETEEAEMISLDFVASGGANAAAIASDDKLTRSSTKPHEDGDKAKQDAKGRLSLSVEEESLIASLRAKINATVMLQDRIRLMSAFIASIPSCYLTEGGHISPEDQHHLTQPVLREISSLVARLPLLTTTPEHRQELDDQTRDIALTKLLTTFGSSLAAAQSVAKRAAVIDQARLQSAKQKSDFRDGSAPRFGSNRGSLDLEFETIDEGLGGNFDHEDDREVAAMDSPRSSKYDEMDES